MDQAKAQVQKPGIKSKAWNLLYRLGRVRAQKGEKLVELFQARDLTRSKKYKTKVWAQIRPVWSMNSGLDSIQVEFKKLKN